MAEAVRLIGVGKRFVGPAGDRAVLRDIDLTIAAGERVALLGASGCGKSTLLRLVAGLDRPTSGEVRLGSDLVTEVDPRCGVVFQEPRLLPWRTVAGNVALGARRVAGALPPADMLQRVGLTGSERVYPHQLSGGMAQRAALARALVGQPQILLLDEPFAALDALTRLRMQDLLIEVARDARPTILLVTHDVDEAIRLADRIVLVAAPRSELAATVAATYPVPRGRPGDPNPDQDRARLRRQILDQFGFDHSAHDPTPLSLVAD